MEPAEVVMFILVLVIIVVSLLSNILVLICFLYSHEIRKQVPGLFNLNLTFCNLLLTVANMPLTLAALASRDQPGGDTLCQAAGFLDTFLSTNSMLSVAALSVDRWIAVVFPLRYRSKMRHRDAAMVLGFTWLHSMSFSMAATCLSWLGYHRLYAACTLAVPRDQASSWTQFVIFTVLFHTFTFVVSFVVLCVTYLKVLKVARFHCRRIDIITMQTLVLLVDIHPSVRQRCLDQQRRRRQRATRKISTFIGTFMICFAPYVITRIVELIPAVPISPHWGAVSKCLVYSKAACDPFAYSLLRHQYRKTYGDIVNRLLKRSPSMNESGRGHEERSDTIPRAE
ncbi:G-protein coupled receptor 26-like [Corythoichthys intestinalis]|uniref:G-protein coupled receptor 26-like n=1 Tax=Corythoichthys intestinalis TaxID=161448 RepID=UPI0025A65AA5|nr:G-protein coupled receptor 26-like [Corythoichthys intestinalis]XP_061807965.1 G-protein coupled receptor 26-like [Nerophis lumbriciformis]